MSRSKVSSALPYNLIEESNVFAKFKFYGKKEENR